VNARRQISKKNGWRKWNNCGQRIAIVALLCCQLTACEPPSFDWLKTTKKTDKTLAEVLPGRWKLEYKGKKYIVTFGRHNEVSLLIDVPVEYRAALGTNQLWIGGNYHVQSDHDFNCQWTDGRWAEMLAQMGGMPLHRVGIKSYTDDEIIDEEDTKLECMSHAPAGNTGEAVDIAAQAPSINDAPRAGQAGQLPGNASLYEEQKKLTILYTRLEEQRKKLTPKNKSGLAAFNKSAEEYSREVAAFNSHRTASTSPKPSPSPAATVRSH
jgi:hypothetical protein